MPSLAEIRAKREDGSSLAAIRADREGPAVPIVQLGSPSLPELEPPELRQRHISALSPADQTRYKLARKYFGPEALPPEFADVRPPKTGFDELRELGGEIGDIAHKTTESINASIDAGLGVMPDPYRGTITTPKYQTYGMPQGGDEMVRPLTANELRFEQLGKVPIVGGALQAGSHLARMGARFPVGVAGFVAGLPGYLGMEEGQAAEEIAGLREMFASVPVAADYYTQKVFGVDDPSTSVDPNSPIARLTQAILGRPITQEEYRQIVSSAVSEAPETPAFGFGLGRGVVKGGAKLAGKATVKLADIRKARETATAGPQPPAIERPGGAAVELPPFDPVRSGAENLSPIPAADVAKMYLPELVQEARRMGVDPNRLKGLGVEEIRYGLSNGEYIPASHLAVDVPAKTPRQKKTKKAGTVPAAEPPKSRFATPQEAADKYGLRFEGIEQAGENQAVFRFTDPAGELEPFTVTRLDDVSNRVLEGRTQYEATARTRRHAERQAEIDATLEEAKSKPKIERRPYSLKSENRQYIEAIVGDAESVGRAVVENVKTEGVAGGKIQELPVELIGGGQVPGKTIQTTAGYLAGKQFDMKQLATAGKKALAGEKLTVQQRGELNRAVRELLEEKKRSEALVPEGPDVFDEVIAKKETSKSGPDFPPDLLEARERLSDETSTLFDVSRATEAKIAKPSDIDFDLARQAHEGSSFYPEKRAKSRQVEYAEVVNSIHEELKKSAKTEAQQAILAEEMARFKENYKKKYEAALLADSRTVSSMITGPSNFPTARNQKRLSTADKRWQEVIDLREEAVTAIKKKLKKQGVEDAGGPIAVMEKKLADAEAHQERMKATNKIAKSKKLTDTEKIAEMAKIDGISEATAKVLLEPNYAGEVGFEPYELTNNNANIKRMRGRIKEMTTAEGRSGVESVGTFEGGEVVMNYDAERLQIIFDQKPDAEARGRLKERGWRWSLSEQAWQRKDTNNARWSLDNVLKGFAATAGTAALALTASQLEEDDLATLALAGTFAAGGFRKGKGSKLTPEAIKRQAEINHIFRPGKVTECKSRTQKMRNTGQQVAAAMEVMEKPGTPEHTAALYPLVAESRTGSKGQFLPATNEALARFAQVPIETINKLSKSDLKEVRNRYSKLRREQKQSMIMDEQLRKEFGIEITEPFRKAVNPEPPEVDVAGNFKEINVVEAGLKDPLRIIEQSIPEADAKKLIDTRDAAKAKMEGFLTEEIQKHRTEVEEGLGIKPGSKMDRAVQQFGEGDWSIEKLTDKFKPEEVKKITDAAVWYRKQYETFIRQYNKVAASIFPGDRSKLIYRRKDYFRHFRELGDLRKLLDIVEDPGGTLNAPPHILAFMKPFTRKLGIIRQRLGGKTDISAAGGYVDYLQQVGFGVHLNPMLKYFRRYSNRMDAAFTKTNQYPRLRGQFREMVDRASGLPDNIDAGIQGRLGKGYDVMSWMNNRAKQNTILGNVGSLVAQYFNWPTAIGEMGSLAFARGMAKSIGQIFTKSDIRGMRSDPMRLSSWIRERYIESNFGRYRYGMINKTRDFAAWAMRTMDEIATKTIWNGFYEQAIRPDKGGRRMTSREAIRHADHMTAKMVAGRGFMELPNAQKARWFQMLAPFQVEVGNAVWAVTDLRKRGTGPTMRNPVSKIATFTLAAYLMNRVAENIRGNPVSFDPLNALVEGIQVASDERRGVPERVAAIPGRLAGEVLGNVPLGQSFAAVYPEYGMNIPGTDVKLPTRKQIFGSNDPTRFGSTILTVDAIKKWPERLLLPFGGVQASKTIRGIKALNLGAVPLSKKEIKIKPTGANTLRALLFGPYATDEAREFFNKRDMDITKPTMIKYLKREREVGRHGRVELARRTWNRENPTRKISKEAVRKKD